MNPGEQVARRKGLTESSAFNCCSLYSWWSLISIATLLVLMKKLNNGTTEYTRFDSLNQFRSLSWPGKTAGGRLTNSSSLSPSCKLLYPHALITICITKRNHTPLEERKITILMMDRSLLLLLLITNCGE